jgi:hypothetical protein
LGSVQGRYVRLTTTQVADGTGWSLSFLDFWPEGSDSDHILGAKATASTSAAGYPASNAADGNSGTLWMAGDGNNSAWVQLDFGSTKQIDRIRWAGGNPSGGSPYPAASPTNYYFQVSNDGINWQQIPCGNSNALQETNAFEVVTGDELVNAQGRYLRIVTTKINDGSGWALSFYEFWAEGY